MNIKSWVIETGRGRDDICEDFDWLVDLIRRKGKDTPGMLVCFFRKIDHISDVFERLTTSLGEQAYVNFTPDGPNDDRNRLFGMYHLKTDQEGVTRVVLCSTSFSMALDARKRPSDSNGGVENNHLSAFGISNGNIILTDKLSLKWPSHGQESMELQNNRPQTACCVGVVKPKSRDPHLSFRVLKRLDDGHGNHYCHSARRPM